MKLYLYIMFIDKFADNLKAKLDERKELKQIEHDAYQAEKCIVDADSINEKRIEAEQKGIDKANKKKSSGFGDRLDRAAERMKESKTETKQKEMPSMIKFG